jgi:hypothetical protein
VYPDSRVDERLIFLTEADQFGVRPALDVEDSIDTPADLVVADHPFAEIRGQRRLAGSA